MARFSSPRDALRVYFAARRGPRASKPRWDGMPSSRDYRPAGGDGVKPPVWVTVGHLLHAPDGCAVEIGSPEEFAVWRWVEGLDERTWSVRKVEDRMREMLRERGLMAKARDVVVREEIEGTPWGRLIRAVIDGGGIG